MKIRSVRQLTVYMNRHLPTNNMLLIDGDWFCCRASFLNQRKGYGYRLSEKGYAYVTKHLYPEMVLEPRSHVYFYDTKDKHAAAKLLENTLAHITGTGLELFSEDLELTEETLAIPTKSTADTAALTNLILGRDLAKYNKGRGWEGKKEVVPIFFFSSPDNWRYLLDLDVPYKGERKKTYPPIHFQGIKEALINSYVSVEVKGMEADDCIALAADLMHTGKKRPVHIVSSDHDFLLLPFNVQVFTSIVKPTSSRIKMHGMSNASDSSALWERVVFKLLIGDKGDNIAGVRGIGPITALKLIKEGRAAGLHPIDILLEQVHQDIDKATREIVIPTDVKYTKEMIHTIALDFVAKNLALISMPHSDMQWLHYLHEINRGNIKDKKDLKCKMGWQTFKVM